MSIACDVEHLRLELEDEQKNKCMARERVAEMGDKIAEFIAEMTAKGETNRPSKYDPFVAKQLQINEKIAAKMEQDRHELEELVKKMAATCDVSGGANFTKDCCHLNICDLLLDYSAMSRTDLLKEMKRFERLQVDLKSNIDRLQWRLDNESKIYYNLLDQYQKLQIELYYLKNLGEKYSFRGWNAATVQ